MRIASLKLLYCVHTQFSTASTNSGHEVLQYINDNSYRITGNFRMVRNFAVFADRSAAAKIRTTNFSSASYGLLVGVVSPEC